MAPYTRKEISKQLSKDKRGLGLGQWGQIVSQTSKNREFKVLPPGHPLIDVRDFLRKPGVEHAASRLKLLRNSLAHLTEFGPGEAELARQDAWSDLETLLSAAEFVTEYPLIHVTDTAWNDIDSTNSLGFRRLTGDSPIVRKEYIQSQSRTIERGSLYLKGANDDLHWLRPTMIGASCPACGHWSTFLIDRYRKGEDVVEYKSLEHGHSLDGPESSARDLAHLGLLPRPTPDHDSADLPANAQRFQLAVEGLRAHGQES